MTQLLSLTSRQAWWSRRCQHVLLVDHSVACQEDRTFEDVHELPDVARPPVHQDLLESGRRQPERYSPVADGDHRKVVGDEEWYVLAGAGPALWLHVVVHFFGEEGSVTTAFGRSRLP